LDLVRNLVAQDLRRPIKESEAIYSAAMRGQFDPLLARQRPLLICGILYGSYLAYGLLVLIADTIFGSDLMNNYFALWAPLHELISHYMPMIGRHSAQLEALGYPLSCPH
jgi:hypothetical protein